MKTRARWIRMTLLAMLCASIAVLTPRAGRAFNEEGGFRRHHGIALADLAGSWAISLGGNTGCGLSSMYVTVDLDATGTGTATVQGSSTGCPAEVTSGLAFQITSLNPDGSGTAGLSCGPGCGWALTIQVPNGSYDIFTVVDVAADNPNNVLVGTAARKWPAP
jgi:hypothetical protein